MVQPDNAIFMTICSAFAIHIQLMFIILHIEMRLNCLVQVQWLAFAKCPFFGRFHHHLNFSTYALCFQHKTKMN